MEKFVILADVACDISKEIRDFSGIEDYFEGHVHISDGRDIKTRLDWENISREDFYKTLSNKKIEVNSAPPSPEDVYLKFKKYVEDGYKILSMSISSKISSTYSVACVAAERVKKEYPDCTIYCFDSYRMAAAFGLLVMYAGLLRKEGKSFDEVVEWLENNKRKVHQMGPIDDLIFVARRGRITMGKAIMGSFAGVKPMGDCSDEGYVSVLAKVKGINKALEATVEYVEKAARDIENQYVIVSHSDREEYANKLKALLLEKVNPKKVFVSDVFSGSGTNIGPGMVGIYFLGDEVSKEQVEEKKLLNEILEKK